MTIAVIGAGRMAVGIAHVFAYAGFPVAVVDAKDRPEETIAATLDGARAAVAKSIGLLAGFGVLDQDQVATILDRITWHARADAAEALKDAAYVFECVPEVVAVKRDAFALICAHAPAEAVISSTTSTILVDELAAFVTEPGRFLNAHWLNPAFLIPLVEVSPGQATDKATVTALNGLLREAGKHPVVCAPSPGFIVPRLQALAMNEAARLVEEGVASPDQIDQATRLGLGLRFAVLGVVEFIDWGGGDILYYASNYLRDALDAPRYQAPEIISDNMAAGRTGMHAGQGFYDFAAMDLDDYQRETIRKFVDLVTHLGLMPHPAETTRG